MELSKLTRQRHSYERLDDEVDASYGPDASEANPTPRKSPDLCQNNGSVQHLPESFNSLDQVLTLFFKQSVRWLGTAILITLIIASLKIYERKGNFPSGQKDTFNTINIALNIGLSLNFFEAFKSSARILRWKFQSWEGITPRERELILDLENLLTVLKLGWESRKKLSILLFCIAWLLLNLLAQTSVALINLTYAIDDGKSWNDTYTTTGVVNASDLTCYYNQYHQKACPTDVTQISVAHSYGELALRSSCGIYDDITDVQLSKYDYGYYCQRERQEFAYRFNEYNPNDTQRVYPLFTNRTITASSGDCFIYSQLGEPTLGRDTAGDLEASNYTYTNGTFNGTISIPKQSTGYSGTTYVYRGFNLPENATTYACGSRCIWMWVHKSLSPTENSTFYQCPISISDVSNVTKGTQNVSDGMARIAAASIALQGRWAPDGFGNKIWTQYQFYPWGSNWDVHNRDPNGTDARPIGADIAEFALGSLSTMAAFNPHVQVPNSSVPYLGSYLTVQWSNVIALFAGIAGVHFLLFTSAIYVTRNVVVEKVAIWPIRRFCADWYTRILGGAAGRRYQDV